MSGLKNNIHFSCWTPRATRGPVRGPEGARGRARGGGGGVGGGGRDVVHYCCRLSLLFILICFIPMLITSDLNKESGFDRHQRDVNSSSVVFSPLGLP